MKIKLSSWGLTISALALSVLLGAFQNCAKTNFGASASPTVASTNSASSTPQSTSNETSSAPSASGVSGFLGINPTPASTPQVTIGCGPAANQAFPNPVALMQSEMLCAPGQFLSNNGLGVTFLGPYDSNAGADYAWFCTDGLGNFSQMCTAPDMTQVAGGSFSSCIDNSTTPYPFSLTGQTIGQMADDGDASGCSSRPVVWEENGKICAVKDAGGLATGATAMNIPSDQFGGMGTGTVNVVCQSGCLVVTSGTCN